ncbi:MAG TPA: hypothetical protein VF736_18715 [Pyrinomonadaceae bacterium]|jgi:hypothetical protein
MGDYLWDKKGEPDAEVERLEALLGTFAHKARPLELPASASAAAPGPGFARRLFAPAWLAAAAALLLASLVVAAVYLRARVTTAGGGGATQSARRSDTGGQGQTPRAVESARATEPPPAAGANENVAPAGEKKGVPKNVKGAPAPVVEVARAQRGPKGSRPAAARKATPPAPEAGAGPAGGFTLEALRARTGADALVETTRLMTKEQLVYALRLTGAKLRDVRERAQGPDDLK